MAKLSLITLIASLTLAFLAANVYAGEQMASGMGRAFGANEIIGVHVKNPRGEVLGRITDFVVDSQGMVALVILSHGGFLRMGEKETAIPFRAFSYDQTDKRLILDITTEKLAAAPTFKMSDLSDPKRAEDFYRYFGQQPYWSEGEEFFMGADQPLEESAPGETSMPYTTP